MADNYLNHLPDELIHILIEYIDLHRSTDRKKYTLKKLLTSCIRVSDRFYTNYINYMKLTNNIVKNFRYGYIKDNSYLELLINSKDKKHVMEYIGIVYKSFIRLYNLALDDAKIYYISLQTEKLSPYEKILKMLVCIGNGLYTVRQIGNNDNTTIDYYYNWKILIKTINNVTELYKFNRSNIIDLYSKNGYKTEF